MRDEGPDSPAETAHRKELEKRMPSRERMTKFVDKREAAIAANGGRDPWLDDSEDTPMRPDDHPDRPVMITRIAIPESNAKPIDNHPDAATSVRLDSLRPGALLSTVTGWRGLKSDTGCCYSYDDGSSAWFDPGTPVWPKSWGGWPPRNALPRSAEPAKGGVT
jgi:hypothetical protein